MLTFRNANYAEFKAEAETLRQMHYLEVAAPRGAGYGLAHDFYAALGEHLRIVMAYEGDTLAGYVLTVVSDDVHDEDRLLAMTTLFYLLPDYRKGRNGIDLFKVAQADLEAFAPGATWRVATPVDPALDRGKLLEYLGLGAVERVYEKRLGGEEEDGGGTL